MPLSMYDECFGGKPGAAAKAWREMTRRYGKERGKAMFYAQVEKHKKEEGKKGIGDRVADAAKKKGGMKGRGAHRHYA